MLEELDLAEALLRFFERLIGAAQILSFTGDDLVSSLHFFDHREPPVYSV